MKKFVIFGLGFGFLVSSSVFAQTVEDAWAKSTHYPTPHTKTIKPGRYTASGLIYKQLISHSGTYTIPNGLYSSGVLVVAHTQMGFYSVPIGRVSKGGRAVFEYEDYGNGQTGGIYIHRASNGKQFWFSYYGRHGNVTSAGIEYYANN